MDWAIKKKGYSQRRACSLAGIDPRVYRYRSRRPGDDALRKRLCELASERRRFGYRRLRILLKREGFHVNWKKLYRIYREERLTVRILCVIDDFTRECLATVVDTSLSGTRVARELDRICETRGRPCMIISDNVLYSE